MKKIYLSDHYVVVKNQQFFEIDHSILTLLYQPIIGYAAVALYDFFLHDANLYCNNTIKNSHSRIFATTNLNEEDFSLARAHLEAMGLLKTLCQTNSDGDHYVYILYPPLTSEQFKANTILFELLQQRLTSRDLKSTLQLFEVKNNFDSTKYSDITLSLPELYDLELDVNDDSSFNNLKLRGRKRKTIFKIDLSMINKTFERWNVSVVLPRSKQLTDYLQRVNLLFNYSNEEIARILLELTYEKNSSRLKFSEIKEYFTALAQPHDNVTSLLDRPHEFQKRSTALMSSFHTLETMTVRECYKSLFQKDLTSDKELILKQIIEEFNFPAGVINAILTYINKNNKQWTYNYLKTLAQSLKKAAVHNSYFIESGAFTYLYLTTIACAYNEKANFSKLEQTSMQPNEKITNYQLKKMSRIANKSTKKPIKKPKDGLIIR